MRRVDEGVTSRAEESAVAPIVEVVGVVDVHGSIGLGKDPPAPLT